MRLLIFKKDLPEGSQNFIRRAGYGFIRDRKTGKESYVRRLGNYHYPRFHVYLEETQDKYIIDLHLDQKQASYKGTKAHSGEYEGENVKEEIERLKSIIK